jgi:hypothetical protein
MFIIKLNDSKNGIVSKNKLEQNNAILVHNYSIYNNIKITDFDYIPDFGILESDWVDELHWSGDFHIKWCEWITTKIKELLYNSNIDSSKKILIVSDSTLDYEDNNEIIDRKLVFKKYLENKGILNKILARGGGSFSSNNKKIKFCNMIYKEKIKKKKYSAIIVIGGMNDTFCSNKKSIILGIKKFVNIANNLINY